MSEHLPAVSSTYFEIKYIWESTHQVNTQEALGESLTTLITKHVINIRYYVRFADCLVSAKSLCKIGHAA